MFDVLDFIDNDKIDLVIGKNIADKFGGVGLLEFLEVENEIVMLVAIYADFAAFFLVNDAVGIDLGDRFCPSFDGAVKGDDDREFGVNDATGKDGGYGFPCANS